MQQIRYPSAVVSALAGLAIATEPRVVGAFLWKWFPPPRRVGRNFQLATPGMTRVIRDAWER